jgi:hypothetical protein
MNVVLLGKREPNPRTLFAQNELGLAIDIGDRNGASEAKRTWRRNLLTYTEDFSNSAWFKNGITATAGKLIENSANSAHLVGLNAALTVPAGTPITYSIEVKAAERSWAVVAFTGGSTTGKYVNLSTGAFGGNFTVAPDSQTIENVGDGWWRVTITRTSSTTSTVDCRVYISTGDGVTSYLGDGASGILVRKAQFELGSTPTTYQPITDFNAEFKAAFPNHSLYVDSNGVAPAVYPGDQVGLVIDSSRGGLENLDSDLVSNGTFATDTVWSKGANWTIGSGVATKTGGAANNLTQTITSTAGLWYRITMDVTRSAGTLTVSLGTSGTTYAITATGTYTFFIFAGSSTQTLTLAGDSAFAGTVDNVTARLVPGNHAYQTTSGSRPALCRTPDGGRRNLLTYSEQFDNAAWVKTGTTVTANTVVNPLDGATTADSLFEVAAASTPRIAFPTMTTGVQYTWSVYAKDNGRDQIRIVVDGDASKSTYFTLTGSGTASPGVNATATITSLGNGWYRCTHTATPTISSSPYIATATGGSMIASGDNTKGVYLFGGQHETGSSATTYQKVTTTHDVTESGKRDCWGLLADGSDDSLITTSVDFSGTDKMTVMAGVRKNSDAAAGIAVELSVNSSTNNGVFAIFAGDLASATGAYWTTLSKGTVRAAIESTNTFPSPITNALSMSANIATDSLIFRSNGTQIGTTSSDQGSGNFGNYPIHLLSRSGSARFSGILYTLIIRGAATPTGTIADFERNLLARRAGTSW